MTSIPLTYKPATNDNWNDLQDLFGEKGAYGGCWCTYFRMPRKDFASLGSIGRKEVMSDILKSGGTPGIIAYLENEPVGWCSVSPRKEFILLNKSRILKPVDDREVWSIVCFYIHKKHRNQGVMSGLIKAAIEHAKDNGAQILEAYPVDPGNEKYPEPYAYTGIYSAFTKLGFVEMARRSSKRPVMRYKIP